MEKEKACKELLIPLALLVIGLVLIIESTGFVLFLPSLSAAIASTFTVSCIYITLKLIAGIIALISGILILKK